jgi:hypothetical protein
LNDVALAELAREDLQRQRVLQPVLPQAGFVLDEMRMAFGSIIRSRMKSLEQILRQLSNGEFEFTRHALRRAVERNISDAEIRQAARNGKRIEDYPEDKYSPSCLILGFTEMGRPLHIQVSYMETEMVRIITLYEPDPDEWTAFSERR